MLFIYCVKVIEAAVDQLSLLISIANLVEYPLDCPLRLYFKHHS